MAFDWFLLFPHALMYATSPAMLWLFALATAVFLVSLPYVKKTHLVAARVDPANCNACGRCVADCPYEAVAIQGGKALVMAERCAACGICAGACPSSTPFRSVAELASGIDLPDATIDAPRRRLQAALPAGEVVFRCEKMKIPGIAVRCLAMLPPAFIEYALRHGAGRVKAVGCEGECAYRLGLALAEERFSRQREPRLRATVLATRNRNEYTFALR
jgi:ferredoxin